jgi:hypothetical protein
MWVYNTTYKTTTRYAPFRLTHGMKALLLVELKVMTLHIVTTFEKNPNAIDCYNLIS